MFSSKDLFVLEQIRSFWVKLFVFLTPKFAPTKIPSILHWQ